MIHKKNHYDILCLFLSLFLGFLSVGWIDPLADKVRKGNLFYHDGKYDDALDNYINVQINSADKPQLDFNIGNTQYKRGRYNEAAQSFEKVMKSNDPKLKAKSNFNMGNALYRQGKLEEALEYYKKTVDFIEEIEPSNDHKIDMLKNDAKFNYEFVDKKLKEEQNQGQDQENQQQKDEDQKNDDEQSEEDKEQQEQQGYKEPPEPDTRETDEKEDEYPDQSQKKDEQEGQPSEQQPQQSQEPRQMSKEEAERLLDALNRSEKEVRAQKRDAQHPQHRSVEKDW